MPTAGDELHHFGWNACSSCLCPNAPHPHVERRYLVVPERPTGVEDWDEEALAKLVTRNSMIGTERDLSPSRVKA